MRLRRSSLSLNLKVRVPSMRVKASGAPPYTTRRCKVFTVYLTNGKGCFEYAHPNRESAVQWYKALYPTVRARVRAEADGEIIQSYVIGIDVQSRDALAAEEMVKVVTRPLVKVQKQVDIWRGCGEFFDDAEHDYCEECLRKRAHPEAWPQEELLGMLDAKLPACRCCTAESQLDRQGLCIICAYQEGKGPVDFIGEITGEVCHSTTLAAEVAA